MRVFLFAIFVGALTLSAGSAYFFFGQKKDDPLVAELFRYRQQVDAVLPKAKTGDVKAQFALAGVLKRANPAFRDEEKALFWFRKAADQGHVEAQFRVGEMYAAGEGAARNYHRASEWFQLAAGLGNHPGAQFALGDLYFHGRGVPHSYGRAINLYRKAAHKGHPVARHVLGLMYKEGWGVDLDLVEAFKWFSLAIPRAAALRVWKPPYDPVKEREKLLKIMNRSQVDRAERLVKAWKGRK